MIEKILITLTFLMILEKPALPQSLPNTPPSEQNNTTIPINLSTIEQYAINKNDFLLSGNLNILSNKIRIDNILKNVYADGNVIVSNKKYILRAESIIFNTITQKLSIKGLFEISSNGFKTYGNDAILSLVKSDTINEKSYSFIDSPSIFLTGDLEATDNNGEDSKYNKDIKSSTKISAQKLVIDEYGNLMLSSIVIDPCYCNEVAECNKNKALYLKKPTISLIAKEANITNIANQKQSIYLAQPSIAIKGLPIIKIPSFRISKEGLAINLSMPKISYNYDGIRLKIPSIEYRIKTNKIGASFEWFSKRSYFPKITASIKNSNKNIFSEISYFSDSFNEYSKNTINRWNVKFENSIGVSKNIKILSSINEVSDNYFFKDLIENSIDDKKDYTKTSLGMEFLTKPVGLQVFLTKTFIFFDEYDNIQFHIPYLRLKAQSEIKNTKTGRFFYNIYTEASYKLSFKIGNPTIDSFVENPINIFKIKNLKQNIEGNIFSNISWEKTFDKYLFLESSLNYISDNNYLFNTPHNVSDYNMHLYHDSKIKNKIEGNFLSKDSTNYRIHEINPYIRYIKDYYSTYSKLHNTHNTLNDFKFNHLIIGLNQSILQKKLDTISINSYRTKTLFSHDISLGYIFGNSSHFTDLKLKAVIPFLQLSINTNISIKEKRVKSVWLSHLLSNDFIKLESKHGYISKELIEDPDIIVFKPNETAAVSKLSLSINHKKDISIKSRVIPISLFTIKADISQKWYPLVKNQVANISINYQDKCGCFKLSLFATWALESNTIPHIGTSFSPFLGLNNNLL